MLINILCLIIGIVATLIWIKLVKPKTPINYQKIAIDKFWLIFTGVTIVAVAYLYFYLPQVFKWLAVDVWGIPASSVGDDKENKVLQLTDLGPLGDIYGSLNTLFTSATLAFVVYATLLQREANKDARDAMADQLQHAKDSSAEQLQQARDATATQLKQARKALKEQLDQAREATAQQIRNSKDLSEIELAQTRLFASDQLDLVQATHDAQINESRNAVFSNAFYTLLNYKKDLLNSLRLTDAQGKESIGNEIFDSFNIFFMNNVEVLNKTTNTKNLQNQYHKKLIELNNGKANLGIYSYFIIYKNIFYLIEHSQLTENEKEIYLSFFRNTIQTSEQMFIFFMCPIYPEFLEIFKNKSIFHCFKTDGHQSYIDQFYDESFFL